MQFLNLLKPHFEWKQISFTGPICHRDLRETDPVPLNHYNQPLITKKSIARWHARLKKFMTTLLQSGKTRMTHVVMVLFELWLSRWSSKPLNWRGKVFICLDSEWQLYPPLRKLIPISQFYSNNTGYASQEGWVNILWSGNDPHIWEKVGNVLISQATPPNHECLKLTTFDHLFWEN